MGKAPSWVFRLEDPNQPPPTIPTLLQVAEAFDVDLNISFDRFSRLLDRLDKMTPESLEVASFNEELELSAFARSTSRTPQARRDDVSQKRGEVRDTSDWISENCKKYRAAACAAGATILMEQVGAPSPPSITVAFSTGGGAITEPAGTQGGFIYGRS
jgi:hypothetical protein